MEIVPYVEEPENVPFVEEPEIVPVVEETEIAPEGTEEMYDDLRKLSCLNESEIVNNLKRRYLVDQIYTDTGRFLIAVNPFARLPQLYNEHMMEQYKVSPVGGSSPHVFAVADASYRAMRSENKSQSILVMGESGAGKTETAKLLVQYLTYVGGGGAAGDDRAVEQQIFQSNLLLEAFGNARTIMNDNSSRFGKFVDIQFDSSDRVRGACITTYLLERSRVVQITDPERSYHCFYQLCASERAAEYKLDHPSHFHYLNQSKTYEIDGVSDAEQYIKTRNAMNIVGISLQDQEAIFSTLAAILHLGNIEFSCGKEHDSSIVKDQKSSFHLEKAAQLLMCEVEMLVTALCTRSIQTTNFAASRDALAKTIYSGLFDWLVKNINKSVRRYPFDGRVIGVLDISGFERFEQNSFEQFCINFEDEILQKLFNQHVFQTEQQEYKEEEIDWTEIKFTDNQDVLDLYEKFIKLLENPRFSETGFTIVHSAGKVTYQTDSFIDKNRDHVVAVHCNMLSSSASPFVASLCTPSLELSSRLSSRPSLFDKSSSEFSSVLNKFKYDLYFLVETLKARGGAHYIRCLRPNSMKKPHNFDNRDILHQIRYGSVLEAVRMSRAAYPIRIPYSELLPSENVHVTTSAEDHPSTLIAMILEKKNITEYQLGRTKVFLRAGQIGTINSLRMEVLRRSQMNNSEKCNQRGFRKFLTRKYAAKCILQCFRSFRTRQNNAAKRVTVNQAQQNGHQTLSEEDMIKMAKENEEKGIQLNALGQELELSNRRAGDLMNLMEEGKQKIIEIFIKQELAMAVRRDDDAAKSTQEKEESNIEVAALRRELEFAKRRDEDALRLMKEKEERDLQISALREELEVVTRSSLMKENKLKDLELSAQRQELEMAKRRVEDVRKLMKEKKQRDLELSSVTQELEKATMAHEMLRLEMETAIFVLEMKLLETINKAATLEAESESKNMTWTKKKHAVNSFVSVSSNALKELGSSSKSIKNIILEARKEHSEDLECLGSKLKVVLIELMDQVASLNDMISRKDEEIERLKLATEMPGEKLGVDQDNNPSEILDYRGQQDLAALITQNNEFLSLCIKKDLGFTNGRPLAACIIYRCLVHWNAFESMDTFKYIIAGIKDALKVGDANITLPYWLSNISALCLLFRKKLKGLSLEEGHPTMWFEKQLTAHIEEIIGLIRDNLKKELSPLMILCIEAPTSERNAGESSRSLRKRKAPSCAWEDIIKLLDTLSDSLHRNHVPKYLLGELMRQIFSYINSSIFNRLKSWRGHCTVSNGEYMKSGLAKLGEWISRKPALIAADSELSHIREAVRFLVTRKRENCTQVGNKMGMMLTREGDSLASTHLLLDDDRSMQFFTKHMDRFIRTIDDLSDIEVPEIFADIPCAQFLFPQDK